MAFSEGKDAHGRPFQKASLTVVHDAEARRLAEHFLVNAGSYVPSQANLRNSIEDNSTPETQLKALDAQHLVDLSVLYEYEAQGFHRDQLDRYQGYADNISRDGDVETIREYEASLVWLPTLDDPTCSGRPIPGSSLAPDALPPYPVADFLRTAHQEATLPSQQALAPARQQADKERMAREKAYPQTAAEYHALPNADARNRVARVLTASAEQQVHLLAKSSWRIGETLSLQREYTNNEAFQAEVKKTVGALNAIPTDPRLRNKASTPR